jgi:alpha-1,2-mannosyltransferase
VNLDRWITSRRLRAHALLLAVTVWGIYIWTIATPGLRDRNGNLKGTDFLHFYTLGSLALEHRGDQLYDMQSQASLAAQRVQDAEGIRYLPLYPPQVSILFAPLALLPYQWALGLWWLCTTLIYGVCCYRIWRWCPVLNHFAGTVALGAWGFPAFFHLIVWGQTSALALACFTSACLLLRDEREFPAGLVLGCLIFKPQLGLAAAILFVFLGRWRIVAGTALSAAAQLAAGIGYYGIEPFRSWLKTMWQVPALLSSFEPRPYQTHCLRTFWSMLVPWSGISTALYAVSGAVVLGWTIAIWKSQESLPLKLSALLLATVLISPHLTVYDLVILAPAILLLANWIASNRSTDQGIGTVLYAVYLLPFLGPFTQWIHVQLSVIAMVGLLYRIWRIATKRGGTAGLRPAGQPRAAVPT